MNSPMNQVHRLTRRPAFVGGAVGKSQHRAWQEFIQANGGKKPDSASFPDILKGFCGADKKHPVTSGPIPALTPILGSGCATTPTGEQLKYLATLPRAIEDQFMGDLPGGTARGTLAGRFAESLLVSRIPEAKARIDDRRTSRTGSTSTQPHAGIELLAHAVLAAALVDRARHSILAHSGMHASSGAGLPFVGNGPVDEIIAANLDPALASLEHARGALEKKSRKDGAAGMAEAQAAVMSMIADAVRCVTEGGKREGLTGGDVDALVETAWLLMIESADMYPGWRETMSSAALEHVLGETAPASLAADLAAARPRTESIDEAIAAAWIQVLRNASKASATAHPKERADFYAAMARVLGAQVDRERKRKTLTEVPPPIAVAYVTGFDLELEMALIAARRKFTVLVPYHVTYGEDESRAAPVWLAGTIDATGRKEATPTEVSPEWVAWSAPREGDLQGDTHPIVVVRLVGSPLFPRAPDDARVDISMAHTNSAESGVRLIKEAELRVRPGDEGPLENPSLVPALVFDEYSGLHHMLGAAHRLLPQLDNVKDQRGRRLAPARFWLGVGVQIADPVVRMALAAHLRNDDVGRAHGAPTNAVIVNRRMSSTDIDLLSWKGFAAVQSEYTELTASMVALAARLELSDDEGRVDWSQPLSPVTRVGDS